MRIEYAETIYCAVTFVLGWLASRSTGHRGCHSWLGVRYNRGAFPDNFVTRMKRRPGVEERMVKILKPHKEITAVYMNLDDGENIERPPNEAYALSIILAYTPDPEPDAATDAAEAAATAIEKRFYEKCHDKKSGEWQHLKLVTCVPLSEDDLTVRQQRLLREWKLEHVSLKAEGGARYLMRSNVDWAALLHIAIFD